jgi:uncharacterized protein YkwD
MTTPSNPRSICRRSGRHPAALSFALLLASCGGGGDSTPASTSTGVVPAASAPASGAAASVGSTCNLADFRAGVLARLNQVRASGANCGSEGVFPAAAAVVWNDRLTIAADGHSRDMAAKNYFSHTSADGRTLSARVDAAGYLWSGLGENIAAGYPGIASVMDGWIGSPGHCANLMNAGFSEVGVACVPGTAGSTYSTYWTMDLGKPR